MTKQAVSLFVNVEIVDGRSEVIRRDLLRASAVSHEMHPFAILLSACLLFQFLSRLHFAAVTHEGFHDP